MRIVDLRSDTFTLPNGEMLKAIATAKLGDDQYFEDETVNKLQECAAKKLGKEDALLVISGTQANLIALMALTHRGDAVILEADSHIFYYEAAGISAIAGVMPKTLKGEFGAINPDDVINAIRVEHKPHEPPSTLLCLENTHNRSGGTCLSQDYMHHIGDITNECKLALHVDGARIFNAAVSLTTDVKNLSKDADSVAFSLSKGLSCPLGSIVTGTKEFCKKARTIRQMLGGAMRQAGIIAAPGLVALETMISRLEDDHKNARLLAKGLIDAGIKISLDKIHTNIVVFNVAPLKMDSATFISRLEEYGVKSSSYGPTIVRMVTHRGIEEEDVEYALEAISHVVKKNE